MQRKLALAFSAGTLLAAAWPSFGFPFLIFAGFVPLLLLTEQILDEGKPKPGFKIFGYSYLTFVTWNALTTWWLWYASGFGMFFAILVNSLLMAFVYRIAFWVRKRRGVDVGYTFLAVAWIVWEQAHMNWDLSWPWLTLGNVFANYPWAVQWYEYTGVFGGSLWVWIVNIGILKSILAYRKNRDRAFIFRGILFRGLQIIVPLLLSWFVAVQFELGDAKQIEVVALQPNVDPYSDKFNTDDMILAEQLVELSEQVVSSDTWLIAGPETSLPGGATLSRAQRYPAFRTLENFQRQHPQTTFLSGASFREIYRREEDTTPYSNRFRNQDLWYDIFNSAFQYSDEKFQVYHKSKLVVGVETVPFRKVLKDYLGNVIINLGGTVGTHHIQEERSVMTSHQGQLRVAPVICYESVYGEFVGEFIQNGANLIAIITNDGWWDNTEGHRQHLAYARLRAIENRRAIVRSANTGVSAIITPMGEIIQSLPYNEKGVVKGQVPLVEEITFYSQNGDRIAALAFWLAIGLLLFSIAKRRQEV